ncbi:MAG: hypothetical protein A2W31_06525 [Planctomycetes bacterium RBG_16_64_10]|nr:MAG: hypothetical protein A2W31_06525 [Planctomycetes bacterium RBG_16_64_10]
MLTARAADGQPMPRGTRVLAPAFSSLTVRRPGVNSLVLQPSSGYFASLSSRYSSVQSMAAGDSVPLPGMTITVLTVTEDGRPMEVLFRFPVALEDRSLHWVCWEAGRFREFRPPGVGAAIELPASGLPF